MHLTLAVSLLQLFYAWWVLSETHSQLLRTVGAVTNRFTAKACPLLDFRPLAHKLTQTPPQGHRFQR